MAHRHVGDLEWARIRVQQVQVRGLVPVVPGAQLLLLVLHHEDGVPAAARRGGGGRRRGLPDGASDIGAARQAVPVQHNYLGVAGGGADQQQVAQALRRHLHGNQVLGQDPGLEESGGVCRGTERRALLNYLSFISMKGLSLQWEEKEKVQQTIVLG